MDNPVTNYRSLRRIVDIATTNAVKVGYRFETVWTSEAINKRDPSIVLSISGTATDGDQSRHVTWDFPVDDAFKKVLELGLLPIQLHIRSKEGFPRHPTDLDIRTQVNPWLALGWHDNDDGSFFGFAVFSKGDYSIEARFDNYPRMENLRNHLMAG